MSEKNAIIQYEGSQITLVLDDRADYVNITEMASAFKGRKSIKNWLKTKQTLDFLCVWEKKHNPNFDGTQMSAVIRTAKIDNALSVKYWSLYRRNCYKISSKTLDFQPIISYICIMKITLTKKDKLKAQRKARRDNEEQKSGQLHKIHDKKPKYKINIEGDED